MRRFGTAPRSQRDRGERGLGLGSAEGGGDRGLTRVCARRPPRIEATPGTVRPRGTGLGEARGSARRLPNTRVAARRGRGRGAFPAPLNWDIEKEKSPSRPPGCGDGKAASDRCTAVTSRPSRGRAVPAGRGRRVLRGLRCRAQWIPPAARPAAKLRNFSRS